MKNEIVKVNPEEFGIEESKAAEISAQFKPMLDKMVDLEKEANEIFKLDIESPESAFKAKELRLKYVKVRTGTADIHKKQKAFYLAGGRFVDGWKNAQIFASEGVEDKLKAIEEYQKRKEEEAIAKLTEERLSKLAKYNHDATHVMVGNMEEDVWSNYFSGVKLAFKQQVEAEKKAEEDRVAKEKAEAEERERVAKENEKLKAEAVAREKEQEEKEMAHKRAEAKRIRDEEVEEKKRLEQKEKEDAAHEAELKKEREAKEKIELELKAKKDADEKAESERLAAIETELTKGDASKKTDLINDLVSIKTKYSFKSKKNQKMYNDVHDLIDKVIGHIN